MSFRRTLASLTLLSPALIPISAGCYNPSSSEDASADGPEDSSTGSGTNATGVSSPGSEDSAADGTTSAGEESSNSGDSTGGPQGCDEPDGTLDPDCQDPSTPFCVGGICAGCEALEADACQGIDPTTPICSDGACTGCVEHDECPTGACRIETGACFPAPNRLWVDNTADCAAATGEERAPFCTLTEAQTLISQQPGSEPWAVFVAGGANPYTDAVNSDPEHPIALIGPNRGLSARIERAEQGVVSGYYELYLSRLSITGGTDVTAAIAAGSGITYLDELVVSAPYRALEVAAGEVRTRRTTMGAQGRTVRVAPGATLLMHDSELANQSGAMLVEGDATLVRSRVHYSYVEAGIEVFGRLRAINTMVYDNYYQFGDIRAQPGSTLELTYSVVGVDGLDCPGRPGQSEQTIRNSIVLGIACPSAVIHNSAVGTDAAVAQGQDNVLILEADFPSVFVNPGGVGDDLDYHVLPDAPLVTDLAVWMDGDPIDDIDGDPRPAQSGALDVAGADVP